MDGTVCYRAIALAPRLVDAHWHRHCLFIIQNDPSSAMAVLETILGLNRRHTKAYRSKYVSTTPSTTIYVAQKFNQGKKLRNGQFVNTKPFSLNVCISC